MSAEPRPSTGIEVENDSRRRSTILAAVETFMSIDPGITLNSVLVFLYVAENQGLTISELAAVSGLQKPTASRCVRSLAERGSPDALPPYLGLIGVRRGGLARNSKTLSLSPAGMDLCQRLERHIGDQIFIEPGPAQASSSRANLRGL